MTAIEAAKELGVVPATIANWRRKYTEFNDAVELALELSNEWRVGHIIPEGNALVPDEQNTNLCHEKGREKTAEH